jgi:hypothetical protein
MFFYREVLRKGKRNLILGGCGDCRRPPVSEGGGDLMQAWFSPVSPIRTEIDPARWLVRGRNSFGVAAPVSGYSPLFTQNSQRRIWRRPAQAAMPFSAYSARRSAGSASKSPSKNEYGPVSMGTDLASTNADQRAGRTSPNGHTDARHAVKQNTLWT